MPSPAEIDAVLSDSAVRMGNSAKNAEIAFFGGSFTAVDRDYMVALLETANKHLDKFAGIRISTRPDCIDSNILDILKRYGVTSIELGAQSMCESVLKANLRGHTAKDVENASDLIKEYSFSLGLQMMTGLYTADFDKDRYTAQCFIKMHPDTVRIYPTVIIDNTLLADLYKKGTYNTYSLEESVKLCSELMLLFEENKIKVIRVGLHYRESLEKNIVYNNYHPAFKELCENRIFRERIDGKLTEVSSNNITVFVSPKSKSKLIGQHRCNIDYLNSLGYNVKIKDDDSLEKYEIRIIDT